MDIRPPLHLDNKLSKAQYCNFRAFLNSSGSHVLPSYSELLKEKKMCHPENISVSETLAQVPVQSLHDHTADRFAMYCFKKIDEKVSLNQLKTLDLTLIYTYGFNGSSGHSMYNQKFSEDSSDSALFASTAVPQKLLSDSFGVIWTNPSPASPRFVRPLRLQFIKETKDVVTSTRNILQQQIKDLQSLKLDIAGCEVSIRADFHLTMMSCFFD
jgi:hypothetical protein